MEDHRNRPVNIVLEGFMGCGKTTVGRIAASLLNYGFVDTDEEVERLAGISMGEMLKNGETAQARHWEQVVCQKLSQQKKLVIATGGGVFANRTNAELLRKQGMVVCLERDFDLVYPVISNDPERPLAFGKTRRELEELLLSRNQCYHQYANTILMNNGDPIETANSLMKAYTLFLC